MHFLLANYPSIFRSSTTCIFILMWTFVGDDLPERSEANLVTLVQPLWERLT